MPARLRLFSDFVCPWCFLAERGPLTKLQGEFELELEWLGFELHPSTPPGGMRLDQLFPAERIEGMHEHLLGMAQKMGVRMKVSDRMPNTRRALALAEQARDIGRLDEVRQACMDAHWLRGEDIEDDTVLGLIAASVGLDPEKAVANTTGPTWQARVDAMRKEATAWGVTGIPTFFLLPEGWTPESPVTKEGPRPVRVVGCQPVEVLREAARMAGAEPR